MGFSKIINYSLGYMLRRKEIIRYFIPCILLYILSNIISVLLLGERFYEMGAYLLVSTVFSLLIFLANIYAMIGVTLSVHRDYQKKKGSISQISGEIMDVLPRLVVFDICLALLFIVIAFIVVLPFFISGLIGFLFLIPGFILLVYLALRLYFGQVILIVEGLGVYDSLKRSYAVTEKKVLTIFLYLIGFSIVLLILGIAIYLVFIVIGLIMGIFLSSVVSGSEAVGLVALILSPLDALFSSYYVSASSVFTYLLYQKIRKEKLVDGGVKSEVDSQVKDNVLGAESASNGTETY